MPLTPDSVIFPTGLDIYRDKVGYGQTIIEGPFTIGTGLNYTLNYRPLAYGSVSIPPLVETSGTPSVGQFLVSYSGTNPGLIQFNLASSGSSYTSTYTTLGEVVQPSWFNNLQDSVINIETFINSGLGLATGNYISSSGGTIYGQLGVSGNLTVNANILTTNSNSEIGDTGTRFNTAYISNINTSTIGYSTFSPTQIQIDQSGISFTSITGISFNSPVSISGDLTTNNVYPTTGNTFDLGTSLNQWKNIYANDVISVGLNSRYVSTSGGTISGILNITSNLTVPSITTNNGLELNSGISVTATGITVKKNIESFGLTDLGSASNPFGTVYANNIAGASLGNSFVHITGDTLQGDLIIPEDYTLFAENIEATGISNISSTAYINLNINGVNKLQVGSSDIYPNTNIIPSTGSMFDVGHPSIHFRAGYFDNIYGNFTDSQLNGLINLTTGTSLIPVSGNVNLGSTGNYFGTIYTDNLVLTNNSGVYVSKAGDTLLGDLLASGNIDLGSNSNPFDNLYVNNIISTSGAGTFVLKTGDTMSGGLTINSVSGLTTDYIQSTGTLTLSGNQINGNATQITLYTTSGPVILDGSTEVQLNVNGTNQLSATSSGIQVSDQFYPNSDSTIDLGTPSRYWRNAYIRSIVGLTGISVSGAYVLKAGDQMTGNLENSANVIIGTFGNNTDFTGSESLIVGETMSGTTINSLLVGSNISVSSSNNILGGGYNNNIFGSNQSIVFGTNITASGSPWSATFGLNNKNYADKSFVVGNDNILHGTSSVCLGYSGITYGVASCTIGSNNTTYGLNSFSVGGGNISSGSHAITLGTVCKAIGNFSIAGGVASTANGTESIALGGAATANGAYSVAMGKYAISNGFASFSEGFQCIASGDYSHAGGFTTVATGNYSLSQGYLTKAYGNSSVALGNLSETYGSASIAAGNNSKAFKDYSIAIGDGSIASGISSLALGKNAISLHNNSFVLSDSNGATSTNTNQLTLGFRSGVSLTSGTSLLPAVSGASSIGTASNPFGSIYANSITTNTLLYNEPISTKSINYTVASTDTNILCITTGTSLIMSLPISASGKVYRFKDKSGNAMVNNITISGVGCTIDGSSTALINANYGKLSAISDGSNFYIID
jgi:hypothetical protein